MNRLTDRKLDGQVKKWLVDCREKQMNQQTDKWTCRQTDRWTGRQMD